jgi:hypothetical protein
MASHQTRPTLDLAAGRLVFEEDLPRALALHGVADPADLGWVRHGARSLLVPFTGDHVGVTDKYTLRLDFLTGRDWPPSARFVDPETHDYTVGSGQHHLPNLQSPEVHIHPAYQSPAGGTIQLICCSAVFEYYDVLHGGDDAILWRTTDTFLVTLAAIGRAMASLHYVGRYPVNV